MGKAKKIGIFAIFLVVILLTMSTAIVAEDDEVTQEDMAEYWKRLDEQPEQDLDEFLRGFDEQFGSSRRVSILYNPTIIAFMVIAVIAVVVVAFVILKNQQNRQQAEIKELNKHLNKEEKKEEKKV